MGFFDSSNGKHNLDRHGHLKEPKAARVEQRHRKMQESYSKRRSLAEKIRANAIIQWLILGIFFTLIIVYSVSLSWQACAMLRDVTNNTEVLWKTANIIEVTEYNVYNDGLVDFETINGTKYSKRKLDFAFVTNEGDDISYYAPQDNMIITELPDGYWWTYLKNSKYLWVFFASVITMLFMMICKYRDWKVFAKPVARVSSIMNLVVVIFAGLLTWITL